MKGPEAIDEPDRAQGCLLIPFIVVLLFISLMILLATVSPK